MSSVRLALTTLVVPDYDAGIAFFVDTFGFDLIEDSEMATGKRWVVVGGKDAKDSCGRLLLAQAANDAQTAAIGNQTGGRVGFFAPTNDFAVSHARLADAGSSFTSSRATRPMAPLPSSAILSAIAGT